MPTPISLENCINIKSDCRFFRGFSPCHFHKSYGVECWEDCEYYDPAPENILIIKLGAIGDVIRSTPLLIRLRHVYPGARIFWLTRYKDVLPDEVDWPLDFSADSIFWLMSLSFVLGINLDKDPGACAVIDRLNVERKYGFGLQGGMPTPLNDLAVHKFVTGISDNVSQKNSKNYLEEIFEIVGWQYKGEDYLLPQAQTNAVIESIAFTGKVIGLNTGCGSRWKTRRWPESYWADLAQKLLKMGFHIILLGGPEEHEKNLRLAKNTGVSYPGYFPILEFISLMKKCHVIVTTVTMAAHFAIGLKIPLVLFNNIFNPREFHFFAPSKIVSPNRSCDCYYLSECVHGESCMKDLSVDTVLEAIQSLPDE